jgi:hypothetical protein
MPSALYLRCYNKFVWREIPNPNLQHSTVEVRRIKMLGGLRSPKDDGPRERLFLGERTPAACPFRDSAEKWDGWRREGCRLVARYKRALPEKLLPSANQTDGNEEIGPSEFSEALTLHAIQPDSELAEESIRCLSVWRSPPGEWWSLGLRPGPE